MKKKISELKNGDTVEIKGRLYDIYDDPSKAEDGYYIFAIVNHGQIDKVRSMNYITPLDLGYEVSLNFENEEIDVLTEAEIKIRNEALFNARIAQSEDEWEDRVAAYSPAVYW